MPPFRLFVCHARSIFDRYHTTSLKLRYNHNDLRTLVILYPYLKVLLYNVPPACFFFGFLKLLSRFILFSMIDSVIALLFLFSQLKSESMLILAKSFIPTTNTRSKKKQDEAFVLVTSLLRCMNKCFVLLKLRF